MRKISTLLILFIGILMSFSSTFNKKSKKKLVFSKQQKAIYPLNFKEYKYQNFDIPFISNDFVGFKEAIGFKESQGLYHKVNKFGYMGKYQFSKNTLEHLDINSKNFLKNPKLQENSFMALCEFNKWVLRKDIKRSIGKKIKGIKITESGILAAAHLAGAGNVKRFLRSNGNFKFKDAFGSSLVYYLQKFSGYDTSFIKANRFPSIN